MSNLPKTELIPYRKATGEKKKASILPVEFNPESLSKEEMQILDLLARAADHMTPIYAQQTDARTMDMYGALENFEHTLDNPAAKSQVEGYNTLFAVRNSPFDLHGIPFTFPIERKRIWPGHALHRYSDLLFEDVRASHGRNLYPTDITNEEFAALGEDGSVVNSSVIRQDGKLKVVLNEERYRRELSPVIAFLQQVEKLSDGKLREYVKAKIHELETGTGESQNQSSIAWIGNTGSVDFILGSAVENYLDKFKGKRGDARGIVYVSDKEFTDISTKLLELVPEWESSAPWAHRKEPSLSNFPKLKYVNVLNSTGGYVTFPTITVAESLPNEKVVADKHGTVNVVFSNVYEAVLRGGGTGFIAREFFPPDVVAKYLDIMPRIQILMIALHELGHTTGGELIQDDPHVYFGEEFPVLEENRADLFSMWALPSLVSHGILTQEQEITGYYAALTTMIRSLELPPNDHTGGENMRFHYLLNHGAVQREGDRYRINPEKMRSVVSGMLGVLGDTKATGNKEELRRLRQQYISDAEKAEVSERLKDLPLGRGLIFPRFKYESGKLTGELEYPLSFREQRSALGNFIGRYTRYS